jgi:hypothetical protein
VKRNCVESVPARVSVALTVPSNTSLLSAASPQYPIRQSTIVKILIDDFKAGGIVTTDFADCTDQSRFR